MPSLVIQLACMGFDIGVSCVPVGWGDGVGVGEGAGVGVGEGASEGVEVGWGGFSWGM